MISDRKWIVYAHINKTNGKQYIGITSQNPQDRWGKNGNQYTKSKHPCFRNAINKYGWDGFEHKILFSGLTEDEAKEKEIELIKNLHTCIYDENCKGYNMTFGGEGVLGHRPSQETLSKMSISHKGDKNNFYGKHHSKLQKEIWSRDRKGKNTGEDNPFYSKHHSKETIKKLSHYGKSRTGSANPNYGNHGLSGENHPMFGKHLSDETRQKISMSLKGKRSGKNSATAKRVLCQENGKVYDTIKLAAIELSVDASSIGKCCKGIYESIKGYHFSFVNEGS